ncbi:hypothetical protein [Verrucosispora sp. WMMD1129]|uniref:hypothetical protein n=1 Tax=Verrucosispora sp. WMMD1129 TaxID=3016093 RepID=UPI00249B4D6D|nr:hypothetical protein [Verrucosispora sp. WMMD1129]WFE45309.1 hypothetical protein O7624_13590 [Verrucosispora sp. WMMD1129]
MSDLLVIVPSRGRPESVARMAKAWRETGAHEHAQLVFAIDADDPRRDDYYVTDLPLGGVDEVVFFHELPAWKPMVHKLNECAMAAIGVHHWSAVAFMGDDHLPRTHGWAKRYLDELRRLRTGIVYGDDGYQGGGLPTQWAMTSDIVQALDRMVPAPVEHLYCDNSILALGQAARCIKYLPDVLIEHMHPVAGKAEQDDQYRRVNSREQYGRDRSAYHRWRRDGLRDDARRIRELRRQG